jgi:hypothetical protein
VDALPLDERPGFRRRFRITPEPGRVCAEVEDDFHCMSVVVHHADGRAVRVEPDMRRAPWTTCPGAVAQLQQTFTGLPLAEFAVRGGKKANCTHLFDLARLAAAHAGDGTPVVFDILVSDPVDGRRQAELRRNGQPILAWVESGMTLVEPAELAGEALWDMRAWIAALDPELREAARLLRWGNMIANGRSIPLAEQSDATRMPPNCYTFQPARAVQARRVGEIRDFSAGSVRPLDDCRPFA